MEDEQAKPSAFGDKYQQDKKKLRKNIYFRSTKREKSPSSPL
jgi:hypothetical protein